MKAISTLGEVSATGLPDQRGLLILDIKPGGLAEQIGMKPHDVIRAINGKPVGNCPDFIQAWAHSGTTKPINATVWRTQQATALQLPPFPGAILSARDATIQGSAVYDQDKNYIGRWTDRDTTLQWKTKLRPNTRYRLLVEQASPDKKPQSWQLLGLTSPINSRTFNTGGWERFTSALLEHEALSGKNDSHTLTIKPLETSSPLMNFRELILIEP